MMQIKKDKRDKEGKIYGISFVITLLSLSALSFEFATRRICENAFSKGSVKLSLGI